MINKDFLLGFGAGKAAGGGGGGGGGVTIKGSFVAGTSDTVQSIDVPYSGAGHPVSMLIYVKGGLLNPAVTNWYDVKALNAVGMWAMCKDASDTAPDYDADDDKNKAIVMYAYKNNNYNAQFYGFGGDKLIQVFSAADPTNSGANDVKISSKTQFKVYIRSSQAGFKSGVEYAYEISYSE